MSNHAITDKLAAASGKVFHYSIHNPYERFIGRNYDRLRDWNDRDAKVYHKVSTEQETALADFKAAANRPTLLKASGRTAGWTVARVSSGIGTFGTRFTVGVAGFLGYVVTGLLPAAVGIIAGAAPLMLLAGVSEAGHQSVLGVKAAGRFAHRVYERYQELGNKDKATPAVEAGCGCAGACACAVEGPANVEVTTPEATAPEVAVPAVEAVAQPAAHPVEVEAPEAMAQPAGKRAAKPAAPATDTPAAPQTRVLVGARAAQRSISSGMGLE